MFRSELEFAEYEISNVLAIQHYGRAWRVRDAFLQKPERGPWRAIYATAAQRGGKMPGCDAAKWRLGSLSASYQKFASCLPVLFLVAFTYVTFKLPNTPYARCKLKKGR